MEIQLKHIHKRFGSIHANDDINLRFQGGRVIGILGENGAGKSTLMKILSGYQPVDSGEIWIDGRQVAYHGPQAAINQGIGMLQQDPLDVSAFTVLENFAYGLQMGFFTSKRALRAQFNAICTRLGFELDSELLISQLSIAQRQQLEVVRLLAQGIRVLILDEPTTGISAEQKDLLFDVLRGLAQNEGMTILLVSHKLEDVIALCDEVVVLRAGRVVGDLQMPATKVQMVNLMFGHEMKQQTRDPVDLEGRAVVLELQDATLRRRRLMMEAVSLQVRAGEILGLAGLDDSGQELIMRALAGLEKLHQGRVYVAGADVTGQAYPQFMRHGVIFGAAGRLEEGLIAGLTLTEHMALVHEQNTIINWPRIKDHTARQISHYHVRGQAHHRIETLSGGNQQRVLMALLPQQATALILEQPTRGLDVDSADWIWQQLLARRAAGTAIVFSSDDLDEILAYSDRILVCFSGQLFMVDDPTRLSVNQLGHLIGGEFNEYAP